MLQILLGVSLAWSAPMATHGSMEPTISQRCALAIAAGFNEIEKDRLGEKYNQTAWEFVREKYRFVRCTDQGRYFNVEFLRNDDPEVRGGVIYFRVDLETGAIVEKMKE